MNIPPQILFFPIRPKPDRRFSETEKALKDQQVSKPTKKWWEVWK